MSFTTTNTTNHNHHNNHYNYDRPQQQLFIIGLYILCGRIVRPLWERGTVAALCRLGGFVYLRVHSAEARMPADTRSLTTDPPMLSAGNSGTLFGRIPRVHQDLPAGQWCITALRNNEGRETFICAAPLCAAVPFTTDSATRGDTAGILSFWYQGRRVPWEG